MSAMPQYPIWVHSADMADERTEGVVLLEFDPEDECKETAQLSGGRWRIVEWELTGDGAGGRMWFSRCSFSIKAEHVALMQGAKVEDAYRRALADYPGRNTHQMQARKVCAGVLKLAEQYRDTPEPAKPTRQKQATVDRGMLRVLGEGEWQWCFECNPLRDFNPGDTVAVVDGAPACPHCFKPLSDLPF